jgi:hypothetical protein
MRTWTNRSGQTMQGKYTRLFSNIVVIGRGSVFVKAPLEELSDEDQAYVLEQVKQEPKRNRGKNGNTPAGKSPSPDTKKKAPKENDPDNPFPDEDEGPDASAGAADKTAKSYPERIWVDTSGNHLAAKFVRAEGDQVVLDAGGEVRSFPLFGFSETDREYLKLVSAPSSGKEGNASYRGSSLYPMPASDPSPSAPAGVPYSPPIRTGSDPFQAMREQEERRRQQQIEAQNRYIQQQQEAERRRQEEALRQQQQQQQQQEEARRRQEEAWRRQQAQPLGPIGTPGFPSVDPSRPMAPPSSSEMQVKYYICSNCKKAVSNPEVGGRCPHCGAVWDFVKDENGKVIKGSDISYTLIFRLIAVIVVAVGSLCGGAKLFRR